jgi:transposase
MFLAGADVGYTDIMVMTAPALQGPWTAAVTVASTCPGDHAGHLDRLERDLDRPHPLAVTVHEGPRPLRNAA